MRVQIKHNGTITTTDIMSLANAIEYAHDLIYNILVYYRGAQDEFYIKDHPSTTKSTPSYYCIPAVFEYRIYHHYKECGWFMSEHKYDKLYSIKIIRDVCPVVQWDRPVITSKYLDEIIYLFNEGSSFNIDGRGPTNEPDHSGD